MKEIKFRFWYNKESRWLGNVRIDNNGDIYVLDDNGDEIVSVDCLQVEKLQYTGLKDKNGKEIYEGDIVGCVTKQFEFPNLGIVEYLEGSFGIYCGKDYAKDELPKLYTWFHYNKDFEVIGNIYEHPELIKSLNNQ